VVVAGRGVGMPVIVTAGAVGVAVIVAAGMRMAVGLAAMRGRLVDVARGVRGLGMRMRMGMIVAVFRGCGRSRSRVGMRVIVTIVGRIRGIAPGVRMIVGALVMAARAMVVVAVVVVAVGVVVVGVGLAPALGRSGHSSLPVMDGIRG
jgi:hypothetical protein